MNPVTPENIQDVADKIDAEAASPAVQEVEQKIVSRLPKPARSAIYEAGKWLGVGGAVVATVAGALEGQPSLYAAAVAAVLLAVNGFIAKAHIA